MNRQEEHLVRTNRATSRKDEQPLGIFKFEPADDETAPDTTDDVQVMHVMGVRATKKIATLTELVRHGAPLKVISKLEQVYGASQKEMYDYLSIPPSTFNRRRQRREHLSRQETDRAVRYARLYKLAKDMMQGNDAATLGWLKSPKKTFGGETPIERATTEAGAAEVKQLIGRIRHGVFS